MRLVWMVLAVLTVLAGTASADRIACECRAGSVLPERGATGVPTNAKIWRLYDVGDVHRATPVSEREQFGLEVIESPLAPNHEFRDDGLGISFTTGAGRDDTPPAVPQNVSVSFVTDGNTRYSEVATASISGGFDPDTALVRLDIYDGAGVLSIITRRDQLFLCEPSIRLASRTVDVDVRALDLAGNASMPVRVRAYVEASGMESSWCTPRADESRAQPHPHRHGHGELWMLVLPLYPVVLLVWLIVAFVRRGMIDRHLAEPLSMLHADAVVHRLRRRQYAWTMFVITAAVAAGVGLHEDVTVLFAPWVISAIAQVLMLRRASALLERLEADAVRRGPWLVVTSLSKWVAVRASDRAFAAGRREAVPRSRAL